MISRTFQITFDLSHLICVLENRSSQPHALSDDAEHDPALSPFLGLLATDLRTRPGEAVRPLTSDVAFRLAGLAEEIGEVDLDAPIEGDVSL